MIRFLYDYIYIGFLSLSAVSYAAVLSGREGMNPALYAAAIMPSFVCTLFFHLKWRERLMLAGLLLAGVTGILLSARFFMEEEVPAEKYLWLLPFVFLSLCAFAAGIMMARLELIRLILAGVSPVLLVLTLLLPIPSEGSGVFFLMFLLLFSAENEIQIHWKREGFTDEKTHMVCSFPFVAVIVLTAFLLPHPDKPYDWKAFRTAYGYMKDVYDRVRFRFDSGSDVITGFSDNGMLLTGLGENKKEILSVDFFSEINAPLYLEGAVFDCFDGHNWTCSPFLGEPEKIMDTAESISALETISAHSGDYYKEIRITLEYLDERSKYLFAPMKLTGKETLDGKEEPAEENGTFVFPEYNPYHYRTREYFLLPNTDSPEFYDFMKSSGLPSKQSFEKAVSGIRSGDLQKNLTYDQYLRYRDRVKAHYYDEVLLSDRVRERLDPLYRGAQSEYEKMKRLEGAFLQMDYTLNPPAIPASVKDASSFLDYFLRESGKGYCSYFATAFVLLARAEGLPARYVQGYRIDSGQKGTCIVSSDMAHAWPEVYFEGKGWIVFEPTPGYFRETAWETSYYGAEAKAPVLPGAPVFEAVSSNQAGQEDLQEEKDRGKDLLKPLLISFGFMLIFLILFYIINRIVRKYRFERMDQLQKQKYLAKDCFAILHSLGKRPGEGETLSEYRKRIQNEVGEEALLFIGDYETAIYSGRNGGSLSEYFDCRGRLMKLLREKSRLKYLAGLLFGYGNL